MTMSLFAEQQTDGGTETERTLEVPIVVDDDRRYGVGFRGLAAAFLEKREEYEIAREARDRFNVLVLDEETRLGEAIVAPGPEGELLEVNWIDG